MADQERVHIKLGISGTYWKKVPQYSISFNGSVVKEAGITVESGVVEYIEFDVDYTTDSAVLAISLTNKEDSDTVENEDKTEIINDMLLNIESLEIDEIDLGQITRDQSVYTTDSPVMWNNESTQTIKNCVNLGWNGTWSLIWTNPFYIWLLESL
jgi:hypothetical protein